MRKRVWALYRVSTDKQTDGNDIPMQKNACRDFIGKHSDWTLDKEILELGVSGFKKSAKDRDALEQIKQGAINKSFEVLLVFMFDRLGRRDDETPFIVEGLTKLGIEVWSVVEGQRKIEEHIEKLINYITFWQAAGESRKTSIRVTESLEQMNVQGGFTGGTIPYGYRLYDTGIKHSKKDKTIKDIEVDDFESGVVKQIFDLVVDKGFGASRIAQILNSAGYKTRNGSLWRHNYISRMLRNSVYMGYKRYGYYDENNHIHMDQIKLQPFNENLKIIDENKFNLVQKIIDSRNARDGANTDSVPTKSQVLLSGIAYCGYCGNKLVADYSNKSWTRRTDGEVSKWKTYKYVCKHGKDGVSVHESKQFGSKKYDNEAVIYAKHLMEKVNVDKLKSSKSTKKTEIVDSKKILKSQIEKELKTEKEELTAIQKILIRVEMGQSQLSYGQVESMLIEQQNKVNEKLNLITKIDTEIDNVEKELNIQYKLEEESVDWSERYDNADFDEKKMMLSRVFDKVIFKKNELEYIINSSLRQFSGG